MTIKLYKVGGCIRDQFLGVKSKDIDYSVEAPSYDAMRDYIASNGKIFLESPEYLTIRAKVNGDDADFVLCRKEGDYTDGRRPDKVEAGDIYDDLARRDFTMNAIAFDIQTQEFIDPHNGMDHINNRLIKCVGEAEERFTEDSLRILRAIRFHITKGFTLADSIIDCLHSYDIVGGLVNVSQERIREEINKCFRADTWQTMVMMEEFPLIRDAVFMKNNMWLEATFKAK